MRVEPGTIPQCRSMPLKSAIAALVLCTVAAIAVLAGCRFEGADTERRPELEAFYEYLFDTFESNFGRDIRVPADESDKVARDRLIDGANRLADRVRRDQQQDEVQSSYEMRWPFINIVDEEPDWDTEFHLEITLTVDELERLGVIER